jgi:hypothetical protein
MARQLRHRHTKGAETVAVEPIHHRATSLLYKNVPHDSFDFLGYTFGRLYSPRTGRPYIGARPSKKSIGRVIDKISAETDRRTTYRSEGEVVHKLNDILRGWANYFRFGTFGKVYGAVDAHARQRLRRWLCGKGSCRNETPRFTPETLPGHEQASDRRIVQRSS